MKVKQGENHLKGIAVFEGCGEGRAAADFECVIQDQEPLRAPNAITTKSSLIVTPGYNTKPWS